MRCPLLAWAVGDPGRFHGAAVVAIGGAAPLLDRVSAAAAGNIIGADWHRLDTHAVAGTATSDAARAQLATVATTMALIGETFAAASRSGRTLAILASIFAPDAEAFDKKIENQPWIADTPIAPIPAGTVAGAYYAICRTQLERTFAGEQAERIRTAAKRIAECQAGGGAVLLVTGGHLFFRGQAIPAALPAVMPYGRAWEWKAPGALRPGDLLLHLGYISYPADEVAATLGAGAGAVVIAVDAGPEDPRVTNLRAGWEAWDAAVPIDGYPYRILPSSGVVLTPLIAAVLAEAEALVAR
jgi:hypothetical protein